MVCHKCGKDAKALHAMDSPSLSSPMWCMPCIELHEPEVARNIKEVMADEAVEDILGIAKDLGLGTILF